MQLINTQNRPLRSELQKVIRITMSVHLFELSLVIFMIVWFYFLLNAQIWTASYGALVSFSFCMNGVSGRKLSSAPPVLWLQRMGGTRTNKNCVCFWLFISFSFLRLKEKETKPKVTITKSSLKYILK